MTWLTVCGGRAVSLAVVARWISAAKEGAENECSGAESYRRHISGGKCSDRTAEVAASELLRRDSEVALRVAELRAVSAVVADRDFGSSRSAWLARLLTLPEKAEAAGDYSAARGCLREIDQAMPQWCHSAVEDNEVLCHALESAGTPRRWMTDNNAARGVHW